MKCIAAPGFIFVETIIITTNTTVLSSFSFLSFLVYGQSDTIHRYTTMVISSYRLLPILLNPSSRKKTSTMQLPALFSILWIFIAAANAESDQLETRDVDLFIDTSLRNDPNLFLGDSHVDVNSMTGPDSHMLLAGHDDLAPTSLLPHTVGWDHSMTESDLASILPDADSTSLLLETESHLFVDTDFGCEAGTADDVQLFGKRRRETLCPALLAPPVWHTDTLGRNHRKTWYSIH